MHLKIWTRFTFALIVITQSGTFRRLVDEISKLHKVNASLQMKCEHAADELQQLKATTEHMQDHVFLAGDTPSKVNIRFYHTSNSRQCTGVNGEAKPYFSASHMMNSVSVL